MDSFQIVPVCVTQLLSVLHTVGQSLDNNIQSDMIYLDFAKAFDTVDHSALLAKLRLYGVKGQLFCWFKDYLTERTQRVVLENMASHWSPVLEQFSLDCHKTKTKVNTLANQRA